MLEHRRAANHPEKYQDNALAKYYITEHKSLSPSLKYRVLKSHLGSDIKRKISEALFIRELKPELNTRDDMQYISRFIA